MDVSTSHTSDRHDGPPFAAFSIEKTAMDPDNIPAEIWQEIFSLVTRSADILNIMLASKRFHILALRALHHTVVWRTPTDVKQSMPFWRDHPGMHLAVERLVCSVPSPFTHNSSGRGIDYASDETWGHWRRDITPEVCNTAIVRMLSFKQLSSVTFTDLQLGYRHFELIYNLPLLRTLRIEKCGVQFGRFLNVFDPSTLPITHLTMRNLRRLEHEFLGDGGAGDNAHALLSLARAPNLHTLVVDPSAEVFKYVFGPGDAPALPPAAAVWAAGHILFPPPHPPPPHLQRLYIERRHQPGRQVPAPPAHYNNWAAAGGPVQAHLYGHIHALGHGGHGFPEAALFAFLQRCPSLTAYGTYHCATQNTQLPAGALPALRAYAGPVGTLLGVVGSGRPIRALRLTNCTGPEAAGHHERERERERERGGNAQGAAAAGPGGAPLPNTATGHREGLPALASVKGMLEDLEELDLEFAAWDDEIMHALVGFFPKLRSLKVTYKVGGPSEVGCSSPFPLSRAVLTRTADCPRGDGPRAAESSPTAQDAAPLPARAPRGSSAHKWRRWLRQRRGGRAHTATSALPVRRHVPYARGRAARDRHPVEPLLPRAPRGSAHGGVPPPARVRRREVEPAADRAGRGRVRRVSSSGADFLVDSGLCICTARALECGMYL